MDMMRWSMAVEPLHSPDGKKFGGTDAASFGEPLVMQVVTPKDKISSAFGSFYLDRRRNGCVFRFTILCFVTGPCVNWAKLRHPWQRG